MDARPPAGDTGGGNDKEFLHDLDAVIQRRVLRHHDDGVDRTVQDVLSPVPGITLVEDESLRDAEHVLLAIRRDAPYFAEQWRHVHVAAVAQIHTHLGLGVRAGVNTPKQLQDDLLSHDHRTVRLFDRRTADRRVLLQRERIE